MSANENSIKEVPTVAQLHHHIIFDEISEAEEMIRSGLEPIDKTLELAVTFGKTEFAQTLLRQYPTLSRKGLLFLAMRLAASKRNTEVLRMLLQNGLKDFEEEVNGQTPLTLLIDVNSPDLMKLVYAHYPEIIKIEFAGQMNLLDLVNQSKTGKSLASYLESLGMKPTVVDVPNETPEPTYANLFPTQSVQAPVTETPPLYPSVTAIANEISTTTPSIYPKVTLPPEESSTPTPSLYPRIIPGRHQDLESTAPTVIPSVAPAQNQPNENSESTAPPAPTELPQSVSELVNSLNAHTSNFSSSATKTAQKNVLLEAVVKKVQLTHGDHPFATKGEFFTREVRLSRDDLPADKHSLFQDNHPLLNKNICVATVLNFQRKFGHSLTSSSKRFFKDSALTNKDKVKITLLLALARIEAEAIPADHSESKRLGISTALKHIAYKPDNASLKELLQIHVSTVSGTHIKTKAVTVLDVIQQHRTGGFHLFSTQSYRDLSKLVGASELRRNRS